MTIRKIYFVNKKGKVTGSVYCKETKCKPLLQEDWTGFADFFFKEQKIPLTMIVVDRRKKTKKGKMSHNVP